MLLIWLVIDLALGFAFLATMVFVLAHFDFLFTVVPEEEIVTGVRGKSFHKAVLFSRTHKLLTSRHAAQEYNRTHNINPLTTITKVSENPDRRNEEVGGRPAKAWDIVPLEEGEKTQGFWWEKMLGVRWLGLWPYVKIFQYEFRWGTMRQQETSSEVASAAAGNVPLYRRETVRTLFVKKYVYVSTLKGVETNQGLPVDILYYFIIMPVNVYDVLFGIYNWLDSVFTEADSSVRSFVGKNSYKELLSDDDKKKREFYDALQDARLRIMDKFSIRILEAGIVSVEPPANYRDVTLAVYTAEERARAEVKTAEGTRDATKAIADGEAYAISAKGEAQAQSLRAQQEAFAANPDAAQTILGAEVGKAFATGPNNTIIGIPGDFLNAGTILGAADKFLGKKGQADKKE